MKKLDTVAAVQPIRARRSMRLSETGQREYQSSEARFRLLLQVVSGCWCWAPAFYLLSAVKSAWGQEYWYWVNYLVYVLVVSACTSPLPHWEKLLQHAEALTLHCIRDRLTKIALIYLSLADLGISLLLIHASHFSSLPDFVGD